MIDKPPGKVWASAMLAAVVAVGAAPCAAQGDAQGDSEAGASNLAKELSNPVAALISVPFQYNYDSDIGPGRGGHRNLLNIQPVIPFTLNQDWNLISRTILPLTWQSGIAPGAGSQSGTGDIVQSIFLSPSKPTSSGIIWGAGPVFLLPSGSDPLLSARKWAAGPTAVALRQTGPWTAGALVNHLWSFAGDSSRAPVDATFIQPFLVYTTPTAWTYGINTESSYDWHGHRWSIPINATIGKLVKIGSMPVSLSVGARYWASAPASGPHGWGGRATVTFLFPR